MRAPAYGDGVRPLHIAALAVVGIATVVAAQPGPGSSGPLPNAQPPILLRLEGVIQPTQGAARQTGFTVTSLAFAGKSAEQRWLGVTKVRTVGGDQVLNGQDVLAAVAPFAPNLFVVGPDDVLARLRDAPPGTAVRVEGIVNRGSRTYFLRRVERDVAGVG